MTHIVRGKNVLPHHLDRKRNASRDDLSRFICLSQDSIDLLTNHE